MAEGLQGNRGYPLPEIWGSGRHYYSDGAMSAVKTGKKNALVIVESPSKAKTIAKYLGPGYQVESSVGHIRDLPSRAAEIPANYKQEAWSRLGVNVDNNFEPLYIIPASKKAQVKKLRDMLKNASALYLATDEDREGEAIAWHLIQVLKPKCPVKRMVFDEITKKAITKGIGEAVENKLGKLGGKLPSRILHARYFDGGQREFQPLIGIHS